MKKIGMVVAVEIQSVMKKYADKIKKKISKVSKFTRLPLMTKYYTLHNQVQEKSELLPVRNY